MTKELMNEYSVSELEAFSRDGYGEAVPKLAAQLLTTMQREEKLREALIECDGYIKEVGQHQGEWEATLFAMIDEALNSSEYSNGAVKENNSK